LCKEGTKSGLLFVAASKSFKQTPRSDWPRGERSEINYRGEPTMKVKQPFVCLFCDKPFSTRVRAKKHDCETKRAAEKRLGAKLAVYDAVQYTIS
jgi:hypothetical protein